MTRLSITLTDAQVAALDRIGAETGANKQSMIGLAITDWIRTHDVRQTRWYGWARTLEDGGSHDHGREAFATEDEAIMHAKSLVSDLRVGGHEHVSAMWEECDADGVPTWLRR